MYPQGMMDDRQPPQNHLLRYFARFEEGEIIRAALYGMLVGTAAVLALDLSGLVERNGGFFSNGQSPTAVTVPVLPPAVEQDGKRRQGADPREFITTPDAGLRGAMTFTLGADGVLRAQGSIAPGSTARLEKEIAAHGAAIKAISLDSPGGSLDDAMAMSRLVRAHGYATIVADGALCASSCPLLLAGGKERFVGPKAAIGLHQFYTQGGDMMRPEQALADAQMTTARISRHLSDMGVDAAIWLHALDTPPRSLYYLTPVEMARYRLVTGGATFAATTRGTIGGTMSR